MAMRTALAGAATAAALLVASGNPGAVEAAREADRPALATTLTDFANWDVADLPGDAIAATVMRLLLTLVLVALLCGLVGRRGSRAAAFVGGWGALAIAAALASAPTYAYQVAVVLDGHTLAPSYLDGLVQAVNLGAAFGVWTGWLVGLVVALVARPEPARAATPVRAVPTAAMPAAAAHVVEPPPPWWAPTPAADGSTAVRPGPSVFPPGGLHPTPAATAPAPAPVPATAGFPEAPAEGPDAGDTREMTTASGDPHPSDPDATQAVGMPAPSDEAGADATSVDTSVTAGTDVTTMDTGMSDADVTTTMDTGVSDADATTTMDSTGTDHAAAMPARSPGRSRGRPRSRRRDAPGVREP